MSFSENPPDPNKLRPEPSVKDDAIEDCLPVSGVPALDPGKEQILVTKVKKTRPEKKRRKEIMPGGYFLLLSFRRHEIGILQTRNWLLK